MHSIVLYCTRQTKRSNVDGGQRRLEEYQLTTYSIYQIHTLKMNLDSKRTTAQLFGSTTYVYYSHKP